MRIGDSIIVALVVLIVFVAARGRSDEREALADVGTMSVESSIDNNDYTVHGGFANRDGAADLLAVANQTILDLMAYCRRRQKKGLYTANQSALVSNMFERYDPDNIAENSPANSAGETSFTINKGERLVLCLRGKTSFDLHDRNVIKFVALHELTHIAENVRNHPRQFWKSFKFVLSQAVSAGLIEPECYDRAPVKYCGMDITYNPYCDDSLEATA